MQELDETIIKKLIEKALDARKNAYAPYSGFRVGAALLGCSRKIYTGCNIENAGYSATNCAERTAFFKAVSEGEKDFICIAILGGADEIPDALCPPCGVCRQVMMEFANPDSFQIILAQNPDVYEIHLLRELFPMGFGPDHLK